MIDVSNYLHTTLFILSYNLQEPPSFSNCEIKPLGGKGEVLGHGYTPPPPSCLVGEIISPAPQYPVVVEESEKYRLWFKQDTVFNSPRGKPTSQSELLV